MSMENQQKFSRGPWDVEFVWDEGLAHIHSDQWGSLARVWIIVDGEVDPRGQANARLIAAAPQMLAALKNVLDWRENGPHNTSEVWGWVKAAIAKAESTS